MSICLKGDIIISNDQNLAIDGNGVIGGHLSCVGNFGSGGPIKTTSGANVSLAANSGAIIIDGTGGGINMGLDGDDIQVRNNGQAAGLKLNAFGGLVTVGSGGLSSSGTINTSSSFKIDGSHQTLTIGEGPGSETVTFDGTVNKTMPAPSPSAKNIEFYHSSGVWEDFDLTDANIITMDYYGANYAGAGYSRWGRSDTAGNLQVNGDCWTGWNVGEASSWDHHAGSGNNRTFCTGGDVGWNVGQTMAFRDSQFAFEINFQNKNLAQIRTSGSATSQIVVMSF